MATALTKLREIQESYTSYSRYNRYSTKFQNLVVDCIDLLSKEVLSKSKDIAVSVTRNKICSTLYCNIAIKYSDVGIFIIKLDWKTLRESGKPYNGTSFNMEIMYGLTDQSWQRVLHYLEGSTHDPEWCVYSYNCYYNNVRYSTPYWLETRDSKKLAQAIYNKVIKNNAELQAYFALNGFPLLSEYKEYFGIVE